uniref:Uncharacterized protein n=1 Tax=Cacopsylla melanoneura TaxID=428564 RepID=A0A8D8V0G2_9HEMI
MVGPRAGRMEPGPLSSRQRAPLSPAPSSAAPTPRPVLPFPSPAQTTLPLRHNRGVHAHSPCPVLLKQTPASPSPLSPTGLKSTTIYKKIVPKCSPPQNPPLYDPLTPIISRVTPSSHHSCLTKQQQQQPLNHSLTLFPSGTFLCTNVTTNSIASFSNVHSGGQIQSSQQRIQSYPQRSPNSLQRSQNSQRIQKYLSCHSRIVPATGAPSKPAALLRSVKKVAPVSKTPAAPLTKPTVSAPCIPSNCCDHDYFKPSSTTSDTPCIDGRDVQEDPSCVGTNGEDSMCVDSVGELRIEDAVEEVVTCDIDMEEEDSVRLEDSIGLDEHTVHNQTDSSLGYKGTGCTLNAAIIEKDSRTVENTPILSRTHGEKVAKSGVDDTELNNSNNRLRNVDRKSIGGRSRRNSSCQQRRRKQQMITDILGDLENFECSSPTSNDKSGGLFGPLSSLEEYDDTSCGQNLHEILSDLESAASLQRLQDLEDELRDSFGYETKDSGSVGYSTSGNVGFAGSGSVGELSCKLADITRGLDLDVEDYEDVGPVVNPCKMFDLELATSRDLEPAGNDLESDMNELATLTTLSGTAGESTCSFSDRGYESVDSPLSSVESELGMSDFLGVNEKEGMSVSEMMGMSEEATSFLMFPDLALEI